MLLFLLRQGKEILLPTFQNLNESVTMIYTTPIQRRTPVFNIEIIDVILIDYRYWCCTVV